MTRGEVKTLIRNWLGTTADDAVYGDQAPGVSAVLDTAVQGAVDDLIDQIHLQSPQYLSKEIGLTPDMPSTNDYSLALQDPPITDFAKWLELRITDENGSTFEECRRDEMLSAGSGYFCITGPDDNPVIHTSPDTQSGLAIWLRYAYWPDDLADDSTVIPAIPRRFHDVVALEALFVYGVGGNSRIPPELAQRRLDRHGRLMAHVSKRGVQPNRTRLDNRNGDYLG